MSRKRRRKYQEEEQSDETDETNEMDAESPSDDPADAAEEAAEAEAAEATETESEQAELVEPEQEVEEAAAEAEEVVVESAGATEQVPNGPKQAERVREAKTYQVKENGVIYQVQPRVLASGETQWTIVAFLPSVQGPVFQGERIPDDAADDLGLSRSTQDMLNAAAERANEQLGLPSSLRGEERERAPLSELEEVLENGGE